jgi:tetratricopeptide (TPR) repeat protein
VLALLLLVLAPASDDPAARAQAAFAAEDYDAVTAALREANTREPKPEYIYGFAQADRLGGRCASALEHYAVYLATDPPQAPAEQARLGIRECRAVLDARDAAIASARRGEVDAARAKLLALQHDADLRDVPELTLALGDVERIAGRCDEARANYEMLASLHPKAEVLALARAHGEDCPENSRTTPPPRVPPGSVAAPTTKRRARGPDRAATALAVIGSTGIATGIGLVAGAFTMRHRAGGASDESEFARRDRTAARMNVAGWSLLAGGSAVLVSAAARWAWLAGPRKRRAARARR